MTTAPVKFAHLWPLPAPLGVQAFYHLTACVPGHCVGSTVSRRTVEALGMVVPEAELARERQARLDLDNAGTCDDHLNVQAVPLGGFEPIG